MVKLPAVFFVYSYELVYRWTSELPRLECTLHHGPDRHWALELDGEHVGKVGLHGEVEDPGDPFLLIGLPNDSLPIDRVDQLTGLPIDRS